jgi:hypothetical protein
MDINMAAQTSIRGKIKRVTEYTFSDKKVVITGKLLKVASIRDEICDDIIDNPQRIIDELSRIGGADIFTFDQKVPHSKPDFPYYWENDNVAVLKIESFDKWWNNQIGNDARRMVRKSQKHGVVTKVQTISDDLIHGIKQIYDETPIRQGKPFWHYKKDFNAVKTENSTYPEGLIFIGAYCNNELIGFNKLFYKGDCAAQIQLISKIKDRDKAPTNALIAKAVEFCAEMGITYLVYGKYSYGKKGQDSLQDFKKRNGFEKMELPKYFVPLTLIGKVAIRCNLHKRLVDLLPVAVVNPLLAVRSWIYSVRYKKTN